MGPSARFRQVQLAKAGHLPTQRTECAVHLYPASQGMSLGVLRCLEDGGHVIVKKGASATNVIIIDVGNLAPRYPCSTIARSR